MALLRTISLDKRPEIREIPFDPGLSACGWVGMEGVEAGSCCSCGAAAQVQLRQSSCTSKGHSSLSTLEDFDFFLRFCRGPAVGLSLPVRGNNRDLPETSTARF